MVHFVAENVSIFFSIEFLDKSKDAFCQSKECLLVEIFTL